MKNIKMLVKPT